MPKTELAMMLAPDLFFGAVYGAGTPGGITDKIIAGTGSAAGGALGGVGLRSSLGIRNPAIGMAVDFAGSYGGDMLGAAAADSVIRARHGGATPYEKQLMMQQMDAEARIKHEARQELLQQLMVQQRYR